MPKRNTVTRRAGSHLSEGLGVILDARKGDIHYHCYDAKTCRMVKVVVWVDDETAQWGRYLPPKPGAYELDLETVQEDRITIYLDRRLVVFNEVDDSEQAQASLGAGLHA